MVVLISDVVRTLWSQFPAPDWFSLFRAILKFHHSKSLDYTAHHRLPTNLKRWMNIPFFVIQTLKVVGLPRPAQMMKAIWCSNVWVPPRSETEWGKSRPSQSLVFAPPSNTQPPSRALRSLAAGNTAFGGCSCSLANHTDGSVAAFSRREMPYSDYQHF